MGRERQRAEIAAGLALVCGLALAFRALGFEEIFPGNGEVLFVVGDGHYHARRALFGFVHFPAILVFDPYLNYPEGAVVPVPPLLDFVVAALARLAGEGVSVFEHVLAWSTPLYGALTPVAIYCAARTLGSAVPALGAGAIFAALPAAVSVSRVGDADHHAAVALLGAAWLALAMASAGARGRRLVLLAAGLALVRLAMLLSWSGALLYVALADGSLLLAALLAGRGDLLGAQAASAWASALLVLPVVQALPEPPGGAWSALSLSQLHVWAVLAVGSVAAALAGLAAWRAPRGAFGSLARGLAVGAAVAGVSLLVFPELREGVLPGLGFLGTAERTGLVTAELQPLVPLTGHARSLATHHWGLFAYAIPLAPLAALDAARDPRVRTAAGVLATWTASFGALAVWQVRYGIDFAPSASVAFALLLARLAGLARRLHAPRPLAAALALALGIVAFVPPLRALYAPQVRASWRVLREGRPLGDPALATPSGSLVRFLQSVRRATPETSGWLDAGGFPEYGVLNTPNLGHALHYVARRASASNGFLDGLDPENFASANRFFEVRSEAAALAIAERLRARYVITMFYPGRPPRAVASRLHRDDGAEQGRRLRHFRLVTEGPAGGRPLGDLFGFPRPADVIPYKLFEIVPGALLEVRGSPGASVEASLEVRTPTGRRFAYAARARVADDGLARLRVPYATGRSTPARALGPWRVRVDGLELTAHVSEADVLEGRSVPVPARGSRAPAATPSADEPPRA